VVHGAEQFGIVKVWLICTKEVAVTEHICELCYYDGMKTAYMSIFCWSSVELHETLLSSWVLHLL